MKFKLFTLLTIGLLFMTSCTKEEQDPVLEIYITTEASDKWTDAEVIFGNMRFVSENESSIESYSNLQSFLGSTYSVALNEMETKLVYNDSHFDYEKLLGFRLLLSSLRLGNLDNISQEVSIPYHDYIPLKEPFAVENGKKYRLDVVLDLDEIITEVNGQLALDPSYTISIEEL